MLISATPFYNNPLFYQPLPFHGKILTPSPFLEKFWKLKLPFINSVEGSNYAVTTTTATITSMITSTKNQMGSRNHHHHNFSHYPNKHHHY